MYDEVRRAKAPAPTVRRTHARGVTEMLQRSIGNRAFGMMLSAPVLQPKLRIGEVNDEYEREADHVADTVMRMPDSLASTPVSIGSGTAEDALQRCACGCGGSCGGSTEEELVQRQADGPASPGVAPSIVHDVLRSPGRPLEASTRAFLEPRFGHDFSGVRIHTDDRAAESAAALSALAYTVGSDIVFAKGKYQPDAASGRRLLAHEMTHTIQQRSGTASRSLQRAPAPETTTDCSGVEQTRWIKDIDVNQEPPSQRVTWTWSDGTNESTQCSTGKGHCCIGPEASQGAACTEEGSKHDGSNCTEVGNHVVASRTRKTTSGVEFWTEFVPARHIALHEYSPVDGTPLSHGCVRLNHDPAVKIWCGSRDGRTKVHVRGLARPRCDHPALQKEWLGDFREAGRTPKDGERFDAKTRAQIAETKQELEHALGVGERELGRRVESLRGATHDFAYSPKASDLAAVAAAIPHCVPTETTEEARLGAATTSPAAGTPRAFIASAGFDTLIAPLERDYKSSKSRTGTQGVLRKHGRALWSAATARAQAATRDTDDRPLYWTRLAMARVIRDTPPTWLDALDPDTHRRTLEGLIDLFEQSSRGMDAATFSDRAPVKRIVISGFDPFSLSTEIRTSNPSGAAALALDGRLLTAGKNSARIEGVIFPVRFPDFDAGVVERFFGPFLSGRRPADMIVTISRGGSQTELEEFAGRRRSTTSPGNLGLSGGGTSTAPVEPPGLGSGAEFLPTTVPAHMLGHMRASLGRSKALAGETDVEALPPKGGTSRTMSGSAAISGGFTAVEGSGGGFLSNEIYYRVLRLVRSHSDPVPMIHLHTEIPAMTGKGAGDAKFVAAREKIVNTVESVLSATLPDL